MHNQSNWYEEMHEGTFNTSSVKKYLFGANCNVRKDYPDISETFLGTLNDVYWFFDSTDKIVLKEAVTTSFNKLPQFQNYIYY
jgi:hypothetical protein